MSQNWIGWTRRLIRSFILTNDFNLFGLQLSASILIHRCSRYESPHGYQCISREATQGPYLYRIMKLDYAGYLIISTSQAKKLQIIYKNMISYRRKVIVVFIECVCLLYIYRQKKSFLHFN